jgi:poly-gamma-glutamate synthesis protein (capsule biosynthesis protein)
MVEADPEVSKPAFEATVSVLPADRVARMEATSWRAGCPTPIADLRQLRVRHWDFESELVWGEVVLHKDAAPVIQAAFLAAFDAGFPFRSVKPASDFGGSDDQSMAADNTSAFNCRRVKGTARWSEHSTGKAIDINPRENPWVKGGRFDPPEGAKYATRDGNIRGLLTGESAVTQTFLAAGWGWGGEWASLLDYQHFSESGT